ncbi:pro-resilin-like [Cephus cinctus]|uniref:Pro-resilin-like n=1 Tax=Cephus cinctus TaxID=211228 RepID=A0AAJ7C3A7_CEPCN|nr:pro-resilin-like [Cephus cinctus]
MMFKVLVLAMMLAGIQSVPQGPAYLPPSGGTGSRPTGGGTSGGGHPDEWAGDPANYEFSYEVQDSAAGLDFGHREMRKDDEATGSYHVLLPDGRTQIVDYVADGGGYRPMVRYEGTATYPAPGTSGLGTGSGPGLGSGSGSGPGSTSGEGYRY